MPVCVFVCACACVTVGLFDVSCNMMMALDQVVLPLGGKFELPFNTVMNVMFWNLFSVCFLGRAVNFCCFDTSHRSGPPGDNGKLDKDIWARRGVGYVLFT
jgi:hypothetical protein